MTLTSRHDDLLLSKINAALQNAGFSEAYFEHASDGRQLLCFASGERYKVRRLDSVRATTLHAIIDSTQRDEEMLLFSFVPDIMACELSRKGIRYADLAGNMFLRLEAGVMQIRNCAKPKLVKDAVAAGRCFTPSGLQALFLLLTEKKALQWNYRSIAEQSGVSLGSVRYIMADLINKKFVLKQGKQRIWADIRLLRRLWVENYALRLLPKIKTWRYAGQISSFPDDGSLLRSGESLAKQLGLLHSGYELFWKQDDNVSRSILANRLRLDEQGNIELRQAFWPVEIRRFERQVPWLLVYADLLANGDGRCLESAEEIRKLHLAEEL